MPPYAAMMSALRIIHDEFSAMRAMPLRERCRSRYTAILADAKYERSRVKMMMMMR